MTGFLFSRTVTFVTFHARHRNVYSIQRSELSSQIRFLLRLRGGNPAVRPRTTSPGVRDLPAKSGPARTNNITGQPMDFTLMTIIIEVTVTYTSKYSIDVGGYHESTPDIHDDTKW